MKITTLKVDLAKYEEIKSHYKEYMCPPKGEYVDFIAEINNITITGYLSKKTNKKITFVGEGSLEEASKWGEVTGNSNKKDKESNSWVDYDTQIGSDEVGVGDFLLPMIVVATYVNKKDIDYLIELGVKDSKKLTDERIREIAPLLIKRLEFSKLTLPNEKYNEMIDKGENLNSLKAKMHNRCLANLFKKHPETVGVYVDQFVSKEKFYEYLDDKNEYKVDYIAFKTKGESYYPSVAAASIIARYSFLLELDRLNEEYHTNFPLGASKKVDEFVIKFTKEHGIETIKKLAKANFNNFNKLLASLNQQ